MEKIYLKFNKIIHKIKLNFAKMLTLKCVVIPMRRKTAANRRISPFYSRFYSKHDLFCRQISLCL